MLRFPNKRFFVELPGALSDRQVENRSSFIGDMMTSDETLEVVRAIITLASTLRIDVVAEGVERSEQRQILNALNVEFAQGYLCSKPLEANQVIDFVGAAREPAPDVAPQPAPVRVEYPDLQSIAVN